MRLVAYPYNGMHHCIREDATHLDLRNLARRRERQGYTVTWLSPTEIEVEDDDAIMIDDRQGIVALVSDDHRIHEAGE